MTHTLLLNANYEVLAFIEEKRAIKLLLKNKVELLSSWDGKKIIYTGGFIEHPATVRMKYQVRRNPTRLSFSKNIILRRDQYQCGYCEKKLTPNRLTIDHVIPQSLGGENSFLNCVTACRECNQRKANKRLEESGLILKIVPAAPTRFLCAYPPQGVWHEEWIFYIN